ARCCIPDTIVINGIGLAVILYVSYEVLPDRRHFLGCIIRCTAYLKGRPVLPDIIEYLIEKGRNLVNLQTRTVVAFTFPPDLVRPLTAPLVGKAQHLSSPGAVLPVRRLNRIEELPGFFQQLR